MDRQPMPPILEAMIRQMNDQTSSWQSRENVADRLLDVAEAIVAAVKKYRGIKDVDRADRRGDAHLRGSRVGRGRAGPR